MKITSVAVLGAGAVGSYVIWGLADREDIKLGVIAEGERKERLSRQGCAINGKVYHPEVWTPEEAENVDFLIVSLKYGALPGALESIRKNSWKRYQCNEPDEWRGQRRDHRRTDWKVTHSSGCD